MVALVQYNAMGSQQPPKDFDWGFLIQPDKSPSPRLEQLCLGLASVISELDPSSSTKELTPEKLAAFYRAVGGNYDSLFLKTPSASLSFIYQSLGCFHTLQPTKNAFEAPSIPALLPHGYIRWQTIQLLLCPEEHAPFLQRAVEMFDIVDVHEGFLLPKSIPASAFPSQPDPDMVRWHETVSNRLESESASTSPHTRPPSNAHPSSSTRTRQSRPNEDEGDYFSQSHYYSPAGRKGPATSRPGSKEPHGRVPHPLRYAEAAKYTGDPGPKTAGYERPAQAPRSKTSYHYRGHSSPPSAYRRSWAHPESSDDDNEGAAPAEDIRAHHQSRTSEQRYDQQHPLHDDDMFPPHSSHARHHSHESMHRQRQHSYQPMHETPRRRIDEEGPEIYYSYPPSKHIPEIKPTTTYGDDETANAFPSPKQHSHHFHPRYVDLFDDDGMINFNHSSPSAQRGSRASNLAERSHHHPAENTHMSPPISPTTIEPYGESIHPDHRSHLHRHQSLRDPRHRKARGRRSVEIRPRSHSRESPSRRQHHYYQDYRHPDDQIHSSRSARERGRERGRDRDPERSRSRPRRGEDETWSESDSSIETSDDEYDIPVPAAQAQGQPSASSSYAPPAPMPPTAGPIPIVNSSGATRETSRRAKYAAKLESTIKNGLKSSGSGKEKRRKNRSSSEAQYGGYSGARPRSWSAHRRRS
ncbi:hypothetical protein MGYG_02785 [Nannizzia gypsea CBS 118893]|uniref:DUF7514 domain-containing protein n=1 Tax=Arthroderma gypseum (strain ATCC MYA-4604 / CBS 118893) TaxID=535722 RepID=E4UP19_ARTGP|nr:hypothetical protein MGYG_02785 [Nannizzia gypsea CBS 118893]EFQ99772.1 hypothetical protein MGYG_02785 [Nannizzia gypsea CBS 118893]